MKTPYLMNSVSIVTDVYLIFLASMMKIVLQAKLTPIMTNMMYLDRIVHTVP